MPLKDMPLYHARAGVLARFGRDTVSTPAPDLPGLAPSATLSPSNALAPATKGVAA
jgi:hypothetical protein